jgi:hypothetical protein
VFSYLIHYTLIQCSTVPSSLELMATEILLFLQRITDKERLAMNT